MERFYVGPLWGNDIIDGLLNHCNEHDEIIFTGGYIFFADSLKIIEKFLHPGTKFRFNKSRFEKYFNIVTGIQQEENYLFRRWINPFSGIIEPLNLYGVTSNVIYSTPEDIPKTVSKNSEFTEHLNFHMSLEDNLIPTKITMEIEKSIISGRAFNEVTVYNEKYEEVRSLAIRNFDIHKKIDDKVNILNKFQYENN